MKNTNKALLKALADKRRRHILSVLAWRDEGIDETELATAIASVEMEKPCDEVTDEQREQVRMGLRHIHLSTLERDGLIERTEEEETISIADDSITENRRVARLLQSPEEVSKTAEQLFSTLAHERRQTIVSILRESDGSLSLKALGTEIVAREEGKDVAEIENETVEKALISLHHSHLPKLSDAGLLEYDRETHSIRENTQLDEEVLSEETTENPFVVISIENDPTEQFPAP